MKKIFLLILMCSMGASLCSCSYTNEKTDKVTDEMTEGKETNKMPGKVSAVKAISHIEVSPSFDLDEDISSTSLKNTWRVECDGKPITMKRLVEPVTILVTDKTLVYELPSEAASYKEIREKVVYAYAYTDNGYWVVPEIRGFIQQNQ